MGKKSKKKGQGAQKTAEKTEKKTAQRIKKELKNQGEEPIEDIIARFQEEDRRKQEIIEELVPPPSKRSNFSFIAHPDKEEIIVFGGEYYNGNKTFMYNDLFFYNIKKNQWISVKAPNGPTPRSAHQAVTFSHGGGQFWIFGGEFASPTQSQFHHFKELWLFHLQHKKWEKISVSGGPCARSGHRMTSFKKQIFVFGGYHDNNREYKYFNDIYMFDLECYKWSKIEATGSIVPSPRSGCQVASVSDGRLLVYGGYSKVKHKKEVDQGIVHSDMFILQKDKHDENQSKWKWVPLRQTGSKPPARCGFSLASATHDRAIIFGGVQDKEEGEEELIGVCCNDMYILRLDSGMWHSVSLHGNHTAKEAQKHPIASSSNRTDVQIPETCSGSVSAENLSNFRHESEVVDELVSDMESSTVAETNTTDEKSEAVVIHEDDVFTITIGPQSSKELPDLEALNLFKGAKENVFWPHPRMNAGMTVVHGILYLFGGLFEEGDKQITLSDMYSLDIKKMDQWHIIIPLEKLDQEWLESSSEDGDDDEDADVEGESEESDDKVSDAL